MEVEELVSRLAQAGTSLCLTGPAGQGKTWLAQAALDSLRDHYETRVFVPMARTPTLEQARQHVVDALPKRTAAPWGQPLQTLAQALADKPTLFVLDGVQASAGTDDLVEELRALLPSSSVLVTSRVPLAALPTQSVTPLSLAAAVALFEAQAPGSGREDVARVCESVGRSPLAIALLARAGSLATLPEGPLALADVYAWTYARLPAAARRLARHLGSFVGPFSEDTAQLASDTEDVADALNTLVAAGWLQRDGTHYRLLEATREFCAERSDDPAAAADRFVEAHAALAKRGGPEVAAQYDNLKQALQLENRRDRGAAMCEALRGFWVVRGLYGDGRRAVARVLARTPAAQPHDEARLLRVAGDLAMLQCEYDSARATLERALSLAGDDALLKAYVSQRLGSIARERADYDAAKKHHEEALHLFRKLNNRHEVARTHVYLAFATWLSGGSPRKNAEQAQVTFEASGDVEGRAWCHLLLGQLDDGLKVARAGDYAEGIAWAQNLIGLRDKNAAALRESLHIHLRLGDWWRAASVLEALALIGATQAARLYASAKAIRARIGTPVPANEQRALAALASLPDAQASDDPLVLEQLAG